MSDDLWHCVFLTGTIVVRRCGEEQWYLPLGDVCCAGALLWPSVASQHGTGSSSHSSVPRMFLPSTRVRRSDIKPVFVTDISDWEAAPIQWCGPAHAAMRGFSLPGAYRTGEPDKLVKVSASFAFFDIGYQPLHRLANTEGVDLSKGKSLFNIITGLVRHFLSLEDGSQELHDILALRIKSPTFLEEFFMDHLGELEATTPDDVGELQKTKQQFDSERSLRKDIKADFKAWRTTVWKPAHAAASKKRGDQRTGKWKPDAKTNRYPPNWPTGTDISQHDARRYLPDSENYHLYKDELNSRWRIYINTHGNLSRSWTLRTSSQAVLELVRWAWSVHTDISGETCPIQGVAPASG